MDKEKVIKGLECCIGKFPGEKYCKTCIYQPYRFGMCKADAIKDAIALLEEQMELIEQYKSACKSCKSRFVGKPF